LDSRWRTLIAYALVVAALVYAIGALQVQTSHACTDRKHQYDALHKVIDKAYTSQRPSPTLLKAFPQLAPFYTPGNAQYDDQQARLATQRGRLIAVLGDRPDC
jgi:hypothetical protein